MKFLPIGAEMTILLIKSDKNDHVPVTNFDTSKAVIKNYNKFELQYRETKRYIFLLPADIPANKVSTYFTLSSLLSFGDMMCFSL